jgi:hypothetical protein
MLPHEIRVLGLLACVVLAACSGGKNATTNDTASTNGLTPIQVVEQLEVNGDLPVLDRSDALAGPDENANGIRDDIDTYIQQQDYPEQQQSAVQQLARELQIEITLGEAAGVSSGSVSRDAATAAFQSSMRAVHCVAARFPGTEFATVAKTYEKLSANTEPRIRAYLAYAHALNGTAIARPTENTCEQ